MAVSKPETKKAPDWERIELDYRAGLLSLREIAASHGITHGAVNKRAKRDGWSRDLKAKIQAKADALVSKAAVSAEVSAERKATEQTVIEANAVAVYRVRMEHREDIASTRNLFRSLLGELKGATDHIDDYEKLFETLWEVPAGEETSKAQDERVRKMRDTLDKVLSAPGRIDGAKRLTEMLEKLVRMERQAFGIPDVAEEDPNPPEDENRRDIADLKAQFKKVLGA